jgi:cytochrome c oxidase subunit 3
MSTDMNIEKKKSHPYQFYLWGGLGSIVMMFAGLTSAYIVKKGQANWLDFDLPNIFVVSTVVILLSSFTMQMAVKKSKEQNENQYRGFIAVTAIFGVLFILLQIQGFAQLEASNIALTGARSNSAASFLFVITGLHLLHVVGGVIALIWASLKAFSTKNNANNDLSIKLISNYWHFVDILWVYLFVFLHWVG